MKFKEVINKTKEQEKKSKAEHAKKMAKLNAEIVKRKKDLDDNKGKTGAMIKALEAKIKTIKDPEQKKYFEAQLKLFKKGES